MLPSEYEIELLVKERVRDGLRRAEQHRLIRETMASRKSQGQRPWAMELKRLLATLAPLRAPEPRCWTLRAAPGLGCQSSVQKGCQT